MRFNSVGNSKRSLTGFTFALATGAAVLLLGPGYSYAQSNNTQSSNTQLSNTKAINAKSGGIEPSAKKFDRRIADAAKKRVAEKVGGLRGTIERIDDDQLITQQEVAQNPNPKTIIPKRQPVQIRKPIPVERRAWQPRKGAKTPLPPMVEAETPNTVDTTITGSNLKRDKYMLHHGQDNKDIEAMNPYPQK